MIKKYKVKVFFFLYTYSSIPLTLTVITLCNSSEISFLRDLIKVILYEAFMVELLLYNYRQLLWDVVLAHLIVIYYGNMCGVVERA